MRILFLLSCLVFLLTACSSSIKENDSAEAETETEAMAEAEPVISMPKSYSFIKANPPADHLEMGRKA